MIKSCGEITLVHEDIRDIWDEVLLNPHIRMKIIYDMPNLYKLFDLIEHIIYEEKGKK